MDHVPASDRVKLRQHLEAPNDAVWERVWNQEHSPRPAPARVPDDEDTEPYWWDPPEVVAARQRLMLAGGPAAPSADEA